MHFNSVALILGELFNLVEEPLCKCWVKIVSYQLEKLRVDMVFCLCVPDLELAKVKDVKYHYRYEFTKV